MHDNEREYYDLSYDLHYKGMVEALTLVLHHVYAEDEINVSLTFLLVRDHSDGALLWTGDNIVRLQVVKHTSQGVLNALRTYLEDRNLFYNIKPLSFKFRPFAESSNKSLKEISRSDIYGIIALDTKFESLKPYLQHLLESFFDECKYAVNHGSYKLDHVKIINSAVRDMCKPDIYRVEFNVMETLEDREGAAGNKEYFHFDEDILEIITSISAQYYEGEKSNGLLLIIDEADYTAKFEFEEPMPFDLFNIRRVRKLLEMAKEFPLVVRNYKIIGIGGNLPEKSAVFKINGSLDWEYVNCDDLLLHYRHGQYTIPRSINVMESKKICSLLRKLFPREHDRAEEIDEMINGLIGKTHGTIIIVTDDAIDECNRLCKSKRGIRCETFDLLKPEHNHFLPHLAAIDGAIIMNHRGECFGIGVILDGESVIEGSTARGARFNSAKNYVAWKKKTDEKHKYLAAILSEDGSIDLIDTNYSSFQYI